MVQEVAGSQQYQYGNSIEVAHAVMGAQILDAAPLFATVSMRRLSSIATRNFRSRISISPITEDQMINGRLTPTARAAWVLSGGGLVNTLSAGVGVDMYPMVVSKQLAFATPTPFAESDSWSVAVLSYTPRTPLGSAVMRKPSLTSVIA